MRQDEWRPYERAPKAETLLGEHAQNLRVLAKQVSTRRGFLYQELRAQRGYAGNYETAKRFVAPLRGSGRAEELCQVRLRRRPASTARSTEGQLSTYFRVQQVTLHLFVLTLGFSRRSYYRACADEQLGQFLEAHERTFEHFGRAAGLCARPKRQPIRRRGLAGEVRGEPLFGAVSPLGQT